MAEWRMQDKPIKGFTLLELLIAISLVLFVILIVMGAMSLGYRSVAWGDRKIEFQERLRATLPILEAQLQSGLPTGAMPTGAGDTKSAESAEGTGITEASNKMYFRGERSGMQFTSNYSLWDSRRGYLQVAYRVAQSSGGKKSLYVSENTLGMAFRREALLLEAADEIYFDYFSANALESGFWVSEWKETAAVPEKVWLHLLCGGKDFSMVVPMRVRRNLIRNVAIPTNLFNTAGAPDAN